MDTKPMQTAMTASYIVVPFERRGQFVGTRQMIVFPSFDAARALAAQMSSQLPGVAILERTANAETGEDEDRVLVCIGAVPAKFPESEGWCLRLH